MTPEQIKEREHAAELMKHNGPWVMEYQDVFLFVGKDGRLYRAQYAPGEWWDDPENHPYTNGWRVEWVRTEGWQTLFPVWR